MDIDDLRSYLVIARLANLRAAADVLHQTPSALSKAVRRLEDALATPLFDRVGKTLRLNAAGERLLARAAELVSMADATAAEFRGRGAPRRCRVAGPALLQGAFGGIVLADGEVDAALVTATALANAASARVQHRPLGQVRMQLALGGGHPLAGRTRVKVAEVLTHDFACIDHSPFCGLPRGTRSDGWRDDQLPRRIRYWVDDLQVLLGLVRHGMALAYLPDFALEAGSGLARLRVTDCPFECVEPVHLAWRAGPGAVSFG